MTQSKLERAVERVVECLRPANRHIELDPVLAQFRAGDWREARRLSERVLADFTTPPRARRAAEFLLDSEPEPKAAAKVLAEPAYGDAVLARAVGGDLPPAVEAAIWLVAAASGYDVGAVAREALTN